MQSFKKVSMSASGLIQRMAWGPRNAIGTEPQIKKPASRRLGEPSRQCTAAPPDL